MIKLRKIKPEEGPEAVRFILSQFEQFIFADYTEAGREAVRQYVTAGSLVADDSENFAYVATLEDSLVGIAKVKRKNHLSMLFIAALCQRQGWGGRLIEATIAECKSRHPDTTHLTANSSRFAWAFFAGHGFRPESEEKQVNGVTFTPMRLDLVGTA